MSKFLTRSGRVFDLLDPRPEMIDIDVIAWSLAHRCRWGGHHGWYSVAEHSVLCSTIVGGDRRMFLAALLHDAHEAYVGDAPSPLKAAMRLVGKYPSDFDNIDWRAAEAVAKRFDLADHPSTGITRLLTEDPLVKLADLQMLWIEADHFAGTPGPPHPLEHFGLERPPIPVRRSIERWSPGLAYTQFLKRFAELT